VFKDDLKRMPGLMPSNLKFKEERDVLRPPQEKPSFPRENHKHKRLLGPGTAVLSSLMCAGYGWLAWLVRCLTTVCANTDVGDVSVGVLVVSALAFRFAARTKIRAVALCFV